MSGLSECQVFSMALKQKMSSIGLRPDHIDTVRFVPNLFAERAMCVTCRD